MNLRLALVCAALTALPATVHTVPAMAQQPYVIYLSNNFVGNDWRQQMLRVAQVSIEKGPLAGKVDLRIALAEGTVQAQINSLNSIIRENPSAILIDAASDSALNPTIKRACDAGILVISFDQTVTEPCAYALESNWDRMPAVMAEWLAEQMKGTGNILVDRGLAGAPISAKLIEGYEAVLSKYPGITIAGYYNGDYALGPEQSGVAALLAAHPQVDGILTQGYGSGAIQALKDAGRKMVPVTGFSYNIAALTCVESGAPCILGSNPAYLSSEAIKLAVEILEGGKRPPQREILIESDFLVTAPFESKLYPDATMQIIKIGVNAFPDQAPGLTLPVTPDWVEITAKEAAGGQ